MSTIDSPPPTVAGNGDAAKKLEKKLEISRYFEALVKLAGSDLHMKVGQPPIIRVKGSLPPLKAPVIDDETMTRLCIPMLDERRRRILDEDGGVDFAFVTEIDGVRWRFRVNLLKQQG